MKTIYELQISREVREVTTVYIEAEGDIQPDTLDEPEVADKLVAALEAGDDPLSWEQVPDAGMEAHDYVVSAKKCVDREPVTVRATVARPSFWDVRVTRFTE